MSEEEENNNDGPSPFEVERGATLQATTADVRTALAKKYKPKGYVYGEGHARNIPALARLIYDGAPMPNRLALRNKIKKSIKLSTSAEKREAKHAPTRRLSAQDLKKATEKELARFNVLLAEGKSSPEAASIIKKERVTGKLAATAKAKATVAAKPKTDSQERQESAEAKLKALKEARLVKAKAEREAKKEAKTAVAATRFNTELEKCIAKCQEKHGAKVGKIEAKAVTKAAEAAAVAEAEARSPQEKILNELLRQLEIDGVDVAKYKSGDTIVNFINNPVVQKWMKFKRGNVTRANFKKYTDFDGYYTESVLPWFERAKLAKKPSGGKYSRKNRSNRKNRSRKNRCY